MVEVEPYGFNQASSDELSTAPRIITPGLTSTPMSLECNSGRLIKLFFFFLKKIVELKIRHVCLLANEIDCPIHFAHCDPCESFFFFFFFFDKTPSKI